MLEDGAMEVTVVVVDGAVVDGVVNFVEIGGMIAVEVEVVVAVAFVDFSPFL